MGKYAATRVFQNDRARRSSNHSTFSGAADYLTEVPKNESQFRAQAFLYGFDPTGLYKGYLNQRDLGNYWRDYLNNTGRSWSDVKYPTMMMGFGQTGSYAQSIFTFSKNIARLYE